MLGADHTVWGGVSPAVECLAGQGGAVWTNAALVRKTLAELLAVFPATHVQLDLAALIAARELDWSGLLTTVDPWPGLLQEFGLAVGSAVNEPRAWGLGLPGPTTLATALGDNTERGVLKAGVRLAGLLQLFRALPVGFVTVDLSSEDSASGTRSLRGIFRNAQLYGWKTAVRLDTLERREQMPRTNEVCLIEGVRPDQLQLLWSEGRLVGGGLYGEFWQTGRPACALPSRCLLYGTVPTDVTARALVEAGRGLQAWLHGE